MGSTFLAWAWALAVAIWLAGSLLTVAFYIISRRISLRGLLTDPVNGETTLVSRQQMLIISLSGAATWIATAIGNVGTTNSFPEVPTTLLAVVGGSQALFIGGRGINAILSRFPALRGRQ